MKNQFNVGVLLSIVILRQQPPRPVTPEPLVIREAPPQPPPQVGKC